MSFRTTFYMLPEALLKSETEEDMVETTTVKMAFYKKFNIIKKKKLTKQKNKTEEEKLKSTKPSVSKTCNKNKRLVNIGHRAEL